MSEKTGLSQRYQNILKATIEYYIATAEPVGSKAIAKKYNFNISSATIRNVMGGLEAAGFLYQPYTSAGRIPSDFGYRMYVDRLLTPDETLSKKLEGSLLQQLSQEKASVEALIQRVTKILAALSGYIAVTTFPQSSSDTLRHLQLVPVSTEQIMLIVVTDSYQTESIVMESALFFNEEISHNEEIIAGELQILSNFLNQHLKGRSLAQIEALNWDWIDQKFASHTNFLKILSKELGSYLQSNSDPPLVIKGIAEVLSQPEFSQLQQVQTLLYLLEKEPDRLLPLIFSFPEEANNSKKVKIKIGSENILEPMQTCTLISANYYADETPVGSVGVIGPTRMLYDNTIALVETTADYLSEAFK
ncbi:Heat-inducible transcription repressor HrcA [Hyella patelloides LEGE 07179]|uniref:Heat-inducible transcription repressor HrcA n=1 Tax=Hyella patelloides LEGE 07179 TaxID=945734 RepID=A0A563W096_9CYAN|nr:heat-inducible transcriptional repressor HrcA [Hyella patelloides]VEP17111.1 Heat-inducible transcription repressor HrcA [Hyella patelloides LEGE 07179]